MDVSRSALLPFAGSPLYVMKAVCPALIVVLSLNSIVSFDSSGAVSTPGLGFDALGSVSRMKTDLISLASSFRPSM